MLKNIIFDISMQSITLDNSLILSKMFLNYKKMCFFYTLK